MGLVKVGAEKSEDWEEFPCVNQHKSCGLICLPNWVIRDDFTMP